MHPLVQQTSLTQQAAWMEKSLHRLGPSRCRLICALGSLYIKILVDWLWCAQLESRRCTRRARAMARAV